MARRDGSFGLLVLLIVMGIVLALVAQAWKRMGATAEQVSEPAMEALDPELRREATEAARSGELPDLEQMHAGTESHAQDVREALDRID